MTQIVVDRIAGSRPTGAAACDPMATRRLDPPLPRRVRRRPARGSGRGAGPILRPVSSRRPRLSLQKPMAHACQLPAPEPATASVEAVPHVGWQLTDRGVAVVLVVGLMIMVAAMTVVGLTALKVTGGGYQASVSASLPR